MVRRRGFGFGLESAMCRPIANSGAVVQRAIAVCTASFFILIRLLLTWHARDSITAAAGPIGSLE